MTSAIKGKKAFGSRMLVSDILDVFNDGSKTFRNI